MLSSGWLWTFGKNITFCWKVGIHLLDERASHHRRPVLIQTATRSQNFIFVIAYRYKLRLFHPELRGMSINYLFLFWPLLLTHCRWWGFIVTLFALTRIRWESHGRRIGLKQGSLPMQHATFTREKHLCHCRDSNRHSQQAKSRRHMP